MDSLDPGTTIVIRDSPGFSEGPTAKLCTRPAQDQLDTRASLKQFTDIHGESTNDGESNSFQNTEQELAFLLYPNWYSSCCLHGTRFVLLQYLDVVSTPCKHSRDPIEHSRRVTDNQHQSVRYKLQTKGGNLDEIVHTNGGEQTEQVVEGGSTMKRSTHIIGRVQPVLIIRLFSPVGIQHRVIPNAIIVRKHRIHITLQERELAHCISLARDL